MGATPIENDQFYAMTDPDQMDVSLSTLVMDDGSSTDDQSFVLHDQNEGDGHQKSTDFKRVRHVRRRKQEISKP